MLTIIVLSSDGYSDCWVPFFNLLKKNFPEIEKHRLILSTNTKSFNYSGLNIETIAHGKDVAWSERLKLSLEKATTDTVLILVEDLFLRSKIDHAMFNEFLLLMNDSNKIDHIRLLSTRDRTRTKKSELKNLDEIEQKTKLRFVYLPGLWKKKTLLKYLVDYESIFVSERLGDIRSWIYNHKFYTVTSERTDNEQQFYDCRPSGALLKGKWQKWIIPFLKENEIDIDFSKRGFVTDEFIKATRKKSKLDMLRNPILTFKSFFSILTLFIKTYSSLVFFKSSKFSIGIILKPFFLRELEGALEYLNSKPL